MNISETAKQWAKDEVFSSMFFILFGLAFLGFSGWSWTLGSSSISEAYVWPMLIVGLLTLTIGIGILIANKQREINFSLEFERDPKAFMESEIRRTKQSLKEYKIIVFKVIPVIVSISVSIIYLVDSASVRAICISIVSMMSVILLVDSLANARLLEYHQQLQLTKNQH